MGGLCHEDRLWRKDLSCSWAQCRGTGEPLQCRAPLSLFCFPSQLGRESLSFSFTVERDIPVRGLKPAQVKVYDYYETDEFATQEYSAPCATVEAEQGNS
nr:alpha-1-macroglobulin-like [Zonotrichia albicollis]